MRNIHILPTPKPSRLYFKNKVLTLGKLIMSSQNTKIINQNIYITSDEEIKEGDWIYCNERKLFGKVVEIQLAKFKSDTSMLYFEINNEEIWCKLFNCKKIILTTDQELIKDGVQAIDDEFLEWFVKNLSCEEVECVYGLINPMGRIVNPNDLGQNRSQCVWKYKIIIPKEEPKQTLEEAAINNYKELYEGEPLTQDVPINAFIDGAKWQQERMYNEEEVLVILHKRMKYTLGEDYKEETTLKWFEQFKKK